MSNNPFRTSFHSITSSTLQRVLDPNLDLSDLTQRERDAMISVYRRWLPMPANAHRNNSFQAPSPRQWPSDLSDVATADLHSDPERMNPELTARKERDLYRSFRTDLEFAAEFLRYLAQHCPDLRIEIDSIIQQYCPALASGCSITFCPLLLVSILPRLCMSFLLTPTALAHSSRNPTRAQAIRDIKQSRRDLHDATEKYRYAAEAPLYWESEVHRISAFIETSLALSKLGG